MLPPALVDGIDGAIVDGLALAATIAGDRDGAAARSGLAEGLAIGMTARLASLSCDAREPVLRALAASLRPALDGARELPPRAAAIVAPEAPRELGARWIAAAGAPRPGFRAPPSLRAQLRRSTPDERHRAAREIAELERAWRA